MLPPYSTPNCYKNLCQTITETSRYPQPEKRKARVNRPTKSKTINLKKRSEDKKTHIPYEKGINDHGYQLGKLRLPPNTAKTVTEMP